MGLSLARRQGIDAQRSRRASGTLSTALSLHGFVGRCSRRLPRSRQLIGLTIVVALTGFAVSVGSATGIAARPHLVSIKSASLSPAERRTVTIGSLNAVGDRSLGLVLTATFEGDVEQYLAQGHVNRGALALVLVAGSGTSASSGLLDEGGGYRRARIPILDQHPGGVTAITRGTLEVVTPDTVLRTSRARGIAVLRDGDRVIFSIPARDLGDVAAIRLEVFATSPIRTNVLSALEWRKVLSEKPADRASLNMPHPLTCEHVDAMLQSRESVSAPDLEPELAQEEHAQANLIAAVHVVSAVARTPGLRGVGRSDLEHDLRETTARIVRLESEIAGVGGVSTAVNLLIRSCTSRPTAPQPTTTSTTTAPRTVTRASAPATTSTTATTTAPVTVEVTQTDSALGQDMASQPSLTFSTAAPTGGVPVIDLNRQVRYQQFTGLGAAMTDSSAWLIDDNLSASDRTTLMQDLFSSAGIDLNFLRVPMGASDFTVSADPYTYDDMPAGETDPDLAHFSIAHDLPYIIPTLKQALHINPGLVISANPWSPPAWMKANDSLDNVDLTGTLLASSYGPLANYFVDLVKAYESQGVPIDIIVPQNEPRSPGGSGTSYPGLTLPEADEEAFISQDLQPALAAAGLNPEIYGNDLSWDKLSYAEPLAASLAGSGLSGIAWHCYAGTPTVMSELEQAYPGLNQIVDECSPEIRSFGAPEYLISALRNWASEAAVWNIALDPQGGPKQVDNGCPGCIGLLTINEQTQTYSFNTEYYELGQVSAFVQPGAVRIDSPNFVTYGLNNSNIETVSAGLDDVAFLNPDGSEALITYNNSTAPITFAVESEGNYISYTIPAQAMATFTWPQS